MYQPGDLVIYRNDIMANHVWKQAKVVDAQHDIRSYTLLNELGNLII